MPKANVKQLPRIPVLVVFFYLGAMLSYVFLILAHETGHFVAASLINPAAISGFYFPIENSYRIFFFQTLAEIPACPNTLACVTYGASVLDSFGLFGGLAVSLAGVATTVVILFFLLKVKRSMELDAKNSEGMFRTSEAAFLLGSFLMSASVSIAWVSDGFLAFLPFIHEVFPTALLISVILTPLCAVAFFAGLDIIVYVAPVYAPRYIRLKNWFFRTFGKEQKQEG